MRDKIFYFMEERKRPIYIFFLIEKEEKQHFRSNCRIQAEENKCIK